MENHGRLYMTFTVINPFLSVLICWGTRFVARGKISPKFIGTGNGN